MHEETYPAFFTPRDEEPSLSSSEEKSSEFDWLERKLTRKQKDEGKTEQVTRRVWGFRHQISKAKYLKMSVANIGKLQENTAAVREVLQKWLTRLSSRMLHVRFLFASPPCIPDLLMAKDFKALVLHVSELFIAFPWIPKNSPQSRIALAQARLDQLNLLDERRLRAVDHVRAYQRKMARAFKKRVKPRSLQRGDLDMKVIKGLIRDPKGKFRPNWSGPYFIRELTLEGAA
ncbi:hypothetical protein CK203_092629 [Vitis vinifera]|uniref:Uncharacterized protein n=1 Tax=Vitis vinifera TaxID=29760 RepID=A0A438BUP6_VITVI|nr:hypothetical protein CK203_092629 [Vitis vinifera]